MVVFVTKMTHFMSVKKKQNSIIYVFNKYISGYVNWNYLINLSSNLLHIESSCLCPSSYSLPVA